MRSISPFHPITYSIGSIESGKTNNIIPEELVFKGSCRFFDMSDGYRFKDELTEILDKVTSIYGCTYTYQLLRGPCFPVINQTDCASMLRKTLA